MKKQKTNHSNNLTNQDYWETAYHDIKLSIAAPNDFIRLFLETHLSNQPSLKNKSCFEVGCFPGRYLAVLGNLGYRLNGIDTDLNTARKLPLWLKSQGYKIGKIQTQDFTKVTPKEKYDLVCSFGFIEHFTNWEKILLKQSLMVKNGGYLVVSTPNFSGFFQRCIHYFLDKENYLRHYVPSMNPTKWAKILEKEGFEIIQAGFLGKFSFWVEDQKRNKLQLILLKILSRSRPTLEERLPSGSPTFAPHCVLIAQKK